MKKVVSVGILLSVVFFLEQMQICFGGNSTSGCIEGERRALLKLKQSFDDPWKRLASWNGEDCCRWSGVSCHTRRRTRHVVHLDLRAPLIQYLDSYASLSAQQVDSSLAELTHLEYLDLSLNYFNRSRIPDFFGSFKHLTYLNLSWAVFGGKIVHQFGNLSSLKVLDLSGNYYGVYADDFQWASSLSSLQHLDMSYVNLTTALDLIPTLTKLPSLLRLQLFECGIGNTHFSVGSINSTFLARIQSLDLSGNELRGEIPNVIHNMTALTQLDLGYQLGYYEFNGLKSEKMQWISSLSALQYLDMSGANLGKAYKLFQVLNSLPSLLRLQLYRCGIGNTHFSVGSINSTFLARIQSLDLSWNELSGEIPNVIHNMTALRHLDLGISYSYGYFGLKSENMEWISRLSSLQHLDLSRVDLSEALDLIPTLTKLPSLLRLKLYGCRIGNTHFSVGSINSTFLARIQSLDLGENDLRGEIPNVIHNMTALRHLDLGSSYSYGYFGLKSENMEWISRLSSLQHLDMNGADFTKAYNLFQALNTLPSLLDLKLRNCGLQTIQVSQATINFTLFSRLHYLDLGRNEISGPISDSLLNRFNSWLGNLTSMRHLHLRNNLLYGPIPSTIGRWQQLRSLDLSDNRLTGTIPQSITRLSALIWLDLSYNQIGGAIPQSFGTSFPFLERLYLSYNHLNGTIPVSLGRLSNLYTLDLSSNCFEGIISEHHFANLSKLTSLGISSSSTNLTWKVKSDWIPPFSLIVLHMSSLKIGPEFPQWLQTQKALRLICLSNAGISGSLPEWLYNFRDIQYLDFSMNLISEDSLERLFDAFPFIGTLFLHDNLISGSIPNSLCKLEGPFVLDFSRNNISGEIPNCFRESQMIKIINFSFNRLFGKIPNSLGHLSYLQRFLANKNALDGVVPLALRNCTYIEILDLSENKLSGSIPPWIGESLSSLRILKLRKNMLIDVIPPQLCKLSKLQILDLSENNLDGKIPRCFGKLTAMTTEGNIAKLEYGYISDLYIDTDEDWQRVKVLESTKGLDNLEFTRDILKLLHLLDLSNNKLVGGIPEELCLLHGLRSMKLSHNLLSGRIPKKIGDLKLLETLDLSDNKLTGEIPPSLSFLQYIAHLNLSNNNLTGKIPQGNQLQTLNDPSIYAGNIELCGDPLPTKCPDHDNHFAQQQRDEDHDDESKEKILFWFIVIAGYATGFWVVIGTFVFKRKWRIAYFRSVDNTKEKLLVMVTVKVAMLKKMTNNSSGE